MNDSVEQTYGRRFIRPRSGFAERPRAESERIRNAA